MTLVELAFVGLVLASFMGGLATALIGVQEAFARSEIIAELSHRVGHAMERIVATTRLAVASDSAFTALPEGTNSAGLRFRLMDAWSGENPVYDDTLRVFILGPEDSVSSNRGIIIGRGPDVSTIDGGARGPDGELGTRDDDTSFSVQSGVPAAEVLVPGRFAPRTGKMLTVDVDPSGRLINYTIRLNAQTRHGDYVLENDLTLSERVALLQ